MPNYGHNSYHQAAERLLGEKYAQHIKSIWALGDKGADDKLTVLFLMEILIELRKLNETLRIPTPTVSAVPSLTPKEKVVLKPVVATTNG